MNTDPPVSETRSLKHGPDTDATPQTVGPYKILKALGEGGFGGGTSALQRPPLHVMFQVPCLTVPDQAPSIAGVRSVQQSPCNPDTAGLKPDRRALSVPSRDREGADD